MKFIFAILCLGLALTLLILGLLRLALEYQLLGGQPVYWLVPPAVAAVRQVPMKVLEVA